jgi:YVTN family beta-propeller protein
VLLCNANRVVSRDRLVDELLGDQPAESAERMLRVQVSRLRKALAVDGDDTRLVARARGYVLRVEEGELDLQTFERLLADGRQALEAGDPERAVLLLRGAEAQWHGRPLADLEFEPFARFEAQRLGDLRVLAVEDRIDAELALGHHAALCPELEALAQEHPLRERIRGQLMLALYRSGRQAEALEAYRVGRTQLVEELALEPGPHLRQLERAILEQDPALEFGPPTRPVALAPDLPVHAAEPAAEDPGSEATGSAAHGSRSRRTVAVAASVALALISATIAAAVVAESSGGSSVAVAANSVAVIAPTDNGVVAQVSVGAQPEGIAAGVGGIWVANTRDHTLSNIDPASRTVTRTLSFDDTVDGVGADAGSLWVLDTANTGVAHRIDATFGSVISTVKLSPFYGTLHSSPTAIAVGDGSAWFGDNAAAVVRVANRGTVASTTNVGNHPSGIAIGAGATWVADDLDDTVSRIDAQGGVSATIPVGQGASGIAVGGGAIWVADTLDNDVVRLDPTTNSVTATIAVGAGPSGLAWGDGSLWVANSGDGTVSRVDPQTNSVVATIPVGQSPQALVVSHGAVWVTVQARPRLAAAAPGSPPGVVRITREHPFQSLDPALVSSIDGDEAQAIYETCAGLLTYPDRPGKQAERLVPDVAESLPAVSDGGRTYTFTVRPGFRFSPPSNAPVTAATFEHTIDRVLSHGVQGYERGFFTDIVGEAAFDAGKTRNLAGVAARGDKLVIRLTSPAPDLPARLAMLSFCAEPGDTPDKPQSQPIPAAGPYYIASSSSDQLVLARNPNYRGRRPRIPREIVYAFGRGFARAVEDVAAGRSDYVSAVPFQWDAPIHAGLFQSLERRYGAESAAARTGHQRYFVNPTATLNLFVLNAKSGLFASTRMRQAVNYAVDRQALVQAAGPLIGGEPISHYVPPAIPGSLPTTVYPLGVPDVAQARKLTGGVHAHATLVTCNTEACTQTAQVIQNDLGMIGIAVDVIALPIDAATTRIAADTGPWDIGWTSWSMDYADPSDYISGMFDPSLQLTLGGFDEPGWEIAIRHARTLTGANRLAVYGTLDDALARGAAPAIAWSTKPARDFFSSRVGCETYQPIYGMDLGQLCVAS